MANKIDIRKLYQQLDRELTEEAIGNLIEKKNKIFYSPKYQRNYVWNSTKAINLIETILINGEIPPITVIVVNDKMEVIDGRQRFETLLKFYNNEFPLRQFGLDQLKDLDKITYENLPINLKTILAEYKIKIILYRVKPNSSLTDQEIEYLKRNLFRKHNCGMTALNRSEIARAKYLYDPLTITLTEKLENDNDFLTRCSFTLLPRGKQSLKQRELINLILVNIRELLVTPYVPIVNTNTIKLGSKVLDSYYEKFIAGNSKEQIINEFIAIFDKLYDLKKLMTDEDYKLKDNILFLKSVYWMLSLIYKQYSKEFYNFDILKFYNYIKNEGQASTYFENYNNIKSDHIKNRHEYVRRYLNLVLSPETNKQIDLYLDAIKENKHKVIYKPTSKINKDEVWYGIGKSEKLKTGKLKFTIKQIINLMETHRFIIRDDYQRDEVKNKVKASRIIESILLGIKIPPIYLTLETGEDHLDRYTVIDGQQRIISVLAFIGVLISNGEDELIRTYKHKYRLTGLKDLDLNGYIFDLDNQKISDNALKDFRLNDLQKQKILDYEIEAITIDLKTNSEFKPIDMFLRMNQSPCNISENSFEMWNSYDIIESIDYIKKIARRDLFKQYGTKMKEEELIAILAYMDYSKVNINNFNNFFRIHLVTENRDKINERIEVKLSINNKKAITDYLENMLPGSKEEKIFVNCLRRVEEFADKILLLTNDDYFKLITIFNPYIEVPRTGSMKDFYITWIIINSFNEHIIKTYQEEILNDLSELFKLMKKMPNGKDEKLFIENMNYLINKYTKKGNN